MNQSVDQNNVKQWPQAILFDLDGTLLTTEEMYFNAWNIVLARYSASITRDEYAYFCGRDVREVLKEIQKRHGIDVMNEQLFLTHLGVTVDELLRKKEFGFVLGAREILEECKNRNIKIAIVTSSLEEFALFKCGVVDLFRYTKIIVHSGMVTKKKPEPEPYQKALALLQVSPKDAIAIEDTSTGVVSATSAGIKTFFVTNSFNYDHVELLADKSLITIEDVFNEL